MLTGFEALGAASAVLQVISFATDVVVACKNAYDGATTSHDDLQRYAGQMSEAVGRVHTRCEQMNNANSKFASPKLQNIAKECKDAADKLEAELQCVTSMQAQGDILQSLRKTFRASRHRKRLQGLQESLSKYRQVMEIELTSHLCSQSNAMNYRQDECFGKLDTDIQFLINQLAQGMTDAKDLVKREHAATRNAIAQEAARAEAAINSHTDSQVLELRTTAERKRKCDTFLQSLKAPRMNQRYNDVMDSRDASFNQVFASYEDMKVMYHQSSKTSEVSEEPVESDDGGESKDNELSETSNLGYMGYMEDVHRSWQSLNLWLQSKDKLFYIEGKPGSGKSTLVKFILNQEQTRGLIRRWSPDAIIISYFFWKIGSEEQNSIKGLWSSFLYQRLQGQQQLILSALQNFSHLSLHSEYYDWSIKDLQDVWNSIAKLDTRHICMFIDGLDEVRNEDGFPKLAQSIQLISLLPRTKLCVSARSEAQIVKWFQTINAAGILLQDLTRFDMFQFVQDRFRQILPNVQVSVSSSQKLSHELVHKAQGVFLWLQLATRSIIEGIENMDSEDILFARLEALPGELENLYIDLWQRMNARNPVYLETARRYFRYVLQKRGHSFVLTVGQNDIVFFEPWIVQITCAENPELLERLLKSTGTVELTEIIRRCEYTKSSIQSRCAGFLEVRPDEGTYYHLFEGRQDNSNPFGHVAFIHRTAHDFLTNTEAGKCILGSTPLSDLSLEAQLLNGFIGTVIAMASEWPLSYTGSNIIGKIAAFAKRWGSESLPLATEMLDIFRSLYDRKIIKPSTYPWTPSDSFFSWLTNEDLLDEFVISRLANDNSTDLATSVLREGWARASEIGPFKGLSKRLFFALIKLGADPHEYATFDDPRMQPFARKITAFTNLLVSFIISTRLPNVEHRMRMDNELQRKKLLETLEIAMHMATTCQNLDAVVSLFSFTPKIGSLMLVPFDELFSRLENPPSTFISTVYEVNIQFLLLYLLSKTGGDLADCVLTAPQFKDALSRIDSPLVKIRYSQLPLTGEDKTEQTISPQPTFQRILSPGPLCIRDIEQLFDVDFEGLSQKSGVPYEDKTDFTTIAKCNECAETEQINMEDIMTNLAAENPGFCTYFGAGIIPPYRFLKDSREKNGLVWRLFPVTMGRLEAAAVMREGVEGHE